MRSGSQYAFSAQRGYALLGLLVALSVLALGMGALARGWNVQTQRDKEAELVWRATEIRRAIESYAQAPAGGSNSVSTAPEFPARLEDLLEDRRTFPPRRHLRRIYADPFTGASDWLLIYSSTQSGRIVGVRSSSRVTALNQRWAEIWGGGNACICEWRFVALGSHYGP